MTVGAMSTGKGTGRKYRCDICGDEDYWQAGWVWWGSDRDTDEEVVPFVQCPKHPVDGRGPRYPLKRDHRDTVVVA